MTREMLYDAITEIKDDLVVEAMEAKPAKSRVRWLKFGSIAAAVALAIGLGAGVFSGKLPWLPIGGSAAGGGGGHDEGSSTFMSYAGPVFPLTTVEGGGGLTAQREITYDFQAWENGTWPYTDLPVTDSYTLTNPTGEDKTVTLLYPFVSSLYDMPGHRPTMTANGMALETDLLTGQYSPLGGGRAAGLPSMSNPESWEQYRELLSDGRYQTSALGDWPDLSHIPVTVYEITNPWVKLGTGNGSCNPTIHAEYALDYSKTRVLSYGFNGGYYGREEGIGRRGFSAPIPPGPDSSIDPDYYEKERAKAHYLIVIGDPVSDFQLKGTSDGSPDSVSYMEWGKDIGADVRQYETSLESALLTVAERMYDEQGWVTHDGTSNRPDFEMYFRMLKDCLLDTGLLLDDPEERYDFSWLGELHFYVTSRVFYLEAQVTVPAGGSITVEAQMIKDASYDFACTGSKNKDVYGYDLVTKLGANLAFTRQTARAVNTDGVEIVRQNFGFDWANGVDTVALDPAEEHYYLEVRRIEKK